MAGDERDVGGARPIGIDGRDRTRADIAARLVVEREELAIALGRREGRVALVERNRRARLRQR